MSGHQPQPARGALLRALAAGATPEALARAFDLGLEPVAPAEGAASADVAEAQVAPRLGPPDGGAGWPSLAPPTSFWRVVGFEATPQPPGGEAAPQAVTTAADAGAGADPLRLPPTPPCGPLAPLLDGLRATCGGRGAGRRIDEDTVVEVIASGAPLRCLPTRPRPRWPARLEVWLDVSPRLATLAADQRRVLVALAEALGPGAVALRRVDGPPERPPADAAGAAQVVLLLGDLGLGGGADEAERWADVGAALRRAGRRPVATCAVQPNALPAGLQRAWAAVPWVDGPSLVAPSAASPGPRRLLAACAAAGLAQPGLIRALRLALGPGLSLADELALASAPEVEGLDDCGLMVRLEAKDALLRTFAEEPAALQAQVWEVIAAWHAHTPPELRAGEALAWSCAGLSVPAEALAEARGFVARVIGTLREGGGEGSPRSWAGWARDLAAAQPSAAGEDAALLRELQVQAERVLADGPPVDPPTRWAIRQVGLQFVLQPEPEVVHPDVPAEAHRPGSPVGWLLAKQTLVVVRDGRRGTPEPLVEGLPVPIDGAETLSLDTGVETLTLGLVRRADDGGWARMGRDRFGLWAEIDVKGAKAEVTQRFRWINPGRFMMGSPVDEKGRASDEGLQHEVTLTRGYWLADTPVTQALYQAVMGVNPSRWRTPPDLSRPVEQVSWHDAVGFVEQLGRLTRSITGIEQHIVFRLPTEAEWEHGCRAGTSGATYAPVGTALKDIAWFGQSRRRMTQPVGQLLPNSWGLFDTLGNVWEWCIDAIEIGAGYPARDRRDPLSLSGPRHLNRGGSWRSAEAQVRAAKRDPDLPSDRAEHSGFRLARGDAKRVGFRLVDETGD